MLSTLLLLALPILGTTPGTTTGTGAGPAASKPRAAAASDRTIVVHGSRTVVRLASADGRETFQISQDGGGSWQPAQPVQGILGFEARPFDPLRDGVPLTDPALTARADAALHVVQFHTQTLDAYRDRLTAMGVEIVGFVPFQAWLVRMPPAQQAAVSALEFVRWTGAYHPAWKIDPALVVANAAGALTAAQRYVLLATRFPQDNAAVHDAVRRAGGESHFADEALRVRIEATLTWQQLVAVAGDDAVLWIEKWQPTSDDMDNVRTVGGANYLEPQKPEGYTGKGIRGHIYEGIYPTHVEFAANAFRSTPIGVFGTAAASHGNATFGVIFARGANAQARGLLPDGQGLFTNSSGSPSRYTIVQALVDPAQPYKAMFQTASWGDATNIDYNATSAEMDRIIFDWNLPITQSQSNTGNRSSRPQAWAKNVISVGGHYHFDNANQADDRWNGGASIGPAADNRIKPDLFHFYDATFTTYSSSGGYANFSGTSNATPCTAGHLGLAIEMFTDGIFGHPMPGGSANRFGNRPKFTTSKAHLMATANEYLMPFADITRYVQGFGQANVRNMFDLRHKTHIVNEWDVLRNLETRSYFFFVPQGTPKLRAVLTWADRPGNPANTPDIINNLDLRVTAPGGTAFWGNNGLITSNWSTAGGVANTIDTVENVSVQNPARGLWQVDVRAAALNQDGRVETAGVVDADYALVVAGIGGGRDQSGMVLDLTTAGSGAGDLGIALTNVPAGWASGYTLLSFATGLPAGLGPVLGLQFDALTSACFGIPAAPGNPIHFTSGGTPAQYPNAPFVLPAGTLSALAGLSMDGVALVLDAAGNVLAVSNTDRVTF